MFYVLALLIWLSPAGLLVMCLHLIAFLHRTTTSHGIIPFIQTIFLFVCIIIVSASPRGILQRTLLHICILIVSASPRGIS